MGWLHATADGLHVRKLKAHHAHGLVPTQAGAESALRGMGAEALGMPPRAWLVVRRVACGGRREALVDALISQRRQAARPWHEDVATDCHAVWFADEAELLACLVRDNLRGPVLQRWWWRSVLAGADVSTWLPQRVAERGELLVAVVVQLMDGSLPFSRTAEPVEAWFAQLSDVQAQQAVDAVARAYAMAMIGALASPSVVDVRAPERRESLTPSQDSERLDPRLGAALQRLAATVPEVRSLRLRPTARRLLAQVLSLVRAPWWARTAQFAQALHQMEHIEALPSTSEPCDDPTFGETPPQRDATVDELMPDEAQTAIATNQEPTPRFTPPRQAFRQGSSAMRGLRHNVADGPPTVVSAVAEQTALTSEVIDPTIAATPANEEAPRALPQQSPARTNSNSHTDFGGLFYLLNAALSLGLYGDFTAPRTPGLALSPWDWLALVGKAWFGDAVVRDPVWALLASLAGRRASDTPGQDFAAPTDWHLNPEWFKPWGRVQTLHLHASKSRLQVLHPAGFVVFDVARNPSLTPHQQALALCRKLKPLRGAALIGGPGLALPRPGTARWLRCLLSHLQARLALALGSATPHHMPELVCRHSAQVTVSTSEVDVAMSLSDLPLPLRIAGLDRDTGWIPAAGRSVRFHFS